MVPPDSLHAMAYHPQYNMPIPHGKGRLEGCFFLELGGRGDRDYFFLVLFLLSDVKHSWVPGSLVSLNQEKIVIQFNLTILNYHNYSLLRSVFLFVCFLYYLLVGGLPVQSPYQY